MAQEDRRIRRTKKLLGDALIALALEKPFEDITIQEITDRADIGYRTFFRHYSDKEELLLDVLRVVRLEMREFMGPPPIEQFKNSQAKDIEQFSRGIYIQNILLFKHVQNNIDLYRVLLYGNRNLLQPLKDFAIQEFKNNYDFQIETGIPFEVIINHTVSAMITLVRWWLDSDLPYSPEEMGEYAYRLIILPIRDLLLETIEKSQSEINPPPN